MSKHDKTHMMYTGTYTNGEGKGIYAFSYDDKDGILQPMGIAAEAGNPSYLTLSGDGKYLYSVMEADGGAVASYAVNNSDMKLDFISSQSTEGKGPCYILLDSTGKYLYAANYSDGKLSMFPVDDKGRIGMLSCLISHSGCGPDQGRQDGPHAHCVTETPDGKYLCAVDLGIDKIMVYEILRESGKLNLSDEIIIKAGSGPRHMTFHPNGKFAYLVTELTSEVIVFSYNISSGFNEIQTISTLPDGYTEDNFCSSIKASPSGKYLYAANRGHDSIAVFRIDDETGMIKMSGCHAVEGKFPRDFEIDPSEKYLYVANQNSDSITQFEIVEDRLEFTGNTINIPNPACIKFKLI